MLKRALWAGAAVMLAGCGTPPPSGAVGPTRGPGLTVFPGSRKKVFDAAVEACIKLDIHVVTVDPPRLINAVAPGRVAGEKVLVNIAFMGPQNVTRVSLYNIEPGSDEASLLRSRIFDAIARKLGRLRPRAGEARARRASRG